MRNKLGQFVKGEKIIRICLVCGKEFEVYPSQLKKAEVKFCSRKCYEISMIGKKARLSFKGKRHSEKTIQKMKIAQLGKKHPNWKGGFPYCRVCKKQLSDRKAKICLECMKGLNNPNWKGGISETLENYWGIRRLRKKNAEGSHTKEEWQELKKKYNYMCLCCKRFEPEITLSKDHIIPLSLGGKDSIENIQPLCRSCNSIKYTKIIDFTKIICPKKKIEIL